MGYEIAMPNLLGPKRAQFTCEEANESRLVTKVRWIVESVNGRIKNVFRFFDHVIPNTYLTHDKLGRLLRIACAMLNAYCPVLLKEKPGGRELAEFMLTRSELFNRLEEKLKTENLIRKRVVWLPVLGSELRDFPRLCSQDLLDITIGVFQIKLAPSYAHRLIAQQQTSEIEDADVLFFYYHRDYNDLLRVHMPSRFRSGQSHQVWIHYEPNSNRGPQAIKSWYCQCRSGARVVGCCAHVACILWYLGFARHQPEIRYPAANLGASLLSAR